MIFFLQKLLFFLQKPNDEVNNEQKGFYISFDNSQPKRPKPPLRTKRSPKKERGNLDVTDRQEQISQLEQELNNERPQGNQLNLTKIQPFSLWKFNFHFFRLFLAHYSEQKTK